MRWVAAFLALLPSVSLGQSPRAVRRSEITLAYGYSAASTDRGGIALRAGYHGTLHPQVAAGVSLLYSPLDGWGADYSPCPPGSACPYRRTGTGLISVLADLELYADPARFGLYLSVGAGPNFWLERPGAGYRLVPGLAAAVGFDLPAIVARIRVEARYLRLLGSRPNVISLGAGTIGVVLPVCMTGNC